MKKKWNDMVLVFAEDFRNGNLRYIGKCLGTADSRMIDLHRQFCKPWEDILLAPEPTASKHQLALAGLLEEEEKK